MKINKSNIHSKQVLPSDEYSFTITQAYFHERVDFPLLVLCHTVDTGEFAYQHALAKFNLTIGSGQARLKRFSDNIGFCWFVDETTDPLFTEQFIALRGVMKVEQYMNRQKKTIETKIIEWSPAVGDPEYNVTKDKDTEVFKTSKQKGKPKLPIQ